MPGVAGRHSPGCASVTYLPGGPAQPGPATQLKVSVSAGWRKSVCCVVRCGVAGKQRYSLNFSKNVVRMRWDGTLNISDDYCLYCRTDGMQTHFYLHCLPQVNLSSTRRGLMEI